MRRRPGAGGAFPRTPMLRSASRHRPLLGAGEAAGGTNGEGGAQGPCIDGRYERAPAAGSASAAVTPAIFFGIFGSIFGDFSFFTLEAKSREICFRKLLLGHL